MASSSTALVPVAQANGRELQVSAEAQGASGSRNACSGCGSQASEGFGRRKWLIAASIALAIAAAVLGSVWFGIAALLPLLYLAPCLAMVAMCMKGGKGSTPAGPATP